MFAAIVNGLGLPLIEAAIVSLVLGIVYFGAAFGPGVPEVRATLRRFRAERRRLGGWPGGVLAAACLGAARRRLASRRGRRRSVGR